MVRTLLKSSQALVAFANGFRSLRMDARRFGAWMARPKLVRSYLQGQTHRKLQIGSGPNLLEGWLNSDYFPTRPGQVYLDATKPFPFPEGTFDYIFSEHVLGEFPYSAGLLMLRECFRALKPGGRIRISTPNLENILTLGDAHGANGIQQTYIRWAAERYLPQVKECEAAFVLNYFFRGHSLVFVYSPELLTLALKTAGFTDITFHEPGQSQDPHLIGLESHGKIVGHEINRFESMVVEAIRP
jgi:SAM-dependent methyltransferase